MRRASILSNSSHSQKSIRSFTGEIAPVLPSSPTPNKKKVGDEVSKEDAEAAAYAAYLKKSFSTTKKKKEEGGATAAPSTSNTDPVMEQIRRKKKDEEDKKKADEAAAAYAAYLKKSFSKEDKAAAASSTQSSSRDGTETTVRDLTDDSVRHASSSNKHQDKKKEDAAASDAYAAYHAAASSHSESKSDPKSDSPPDLKTQKQTDDYYDVKASPAIDRGLTTPAAKGTTSVSYSTKYAREDSTSSIHTTQKKDSPPDAKIQQHDDYYEVEPSPAVDRHYSTPAAKGTTSVSYSTKYARDPTTTPALFNNDPKNNTDPSSNSNFSEMVDLPTALPSATATRVSGSSNNENEYPVAETILGVGMGVDIEQQKDEYYEAEPSPAVDRRFSSPSAQKTTSVTYSTKYVRDPTATTPVASAANSSDIENDSSNSSMDTPGLTPTATVATPNTPRLAVVELPATVAKAKATTATSTPDGRDPTNMTQLVDDSSPDSKETTSSSPSTRNSSSPEDPTGTTNSSQNNTPFFRAPKNESDGSSPDTKNTNTSSSSNTTTDPDGGLMRKGSRDADSSENADDSYDSDNNLELVVAASSSSSSSKLKQPPPQTPNTQNVDGQQGLPRRRISWLDSTHEANNRLSQTSSSRFSRNSGQNNSATSDEYYDVEESEHASVSRSHHNRNMTTMRRESSEAESRERAQRIRALRLAANATAGKGGTDPDGATGGGGEDGDDAYSTHGENFAPTRDDDDTFDSSPENNNETYNDTYNDSDSTNNNESPSNNGGGSDEKEDEDESNEYKRKYSYGTAAPDSYGSSSSRSSSSTSTSGEMNNNDLEIGQSSSQPATATASATQQQSSSSLQQKQYSSRRKHSTFPSKACIIGMVILVVLVLGGLIAGLTWYLWDKQRLQPLPPPPTTEPILLTTQLPVPTSSPSSALVSTPSAPTPTIEIIIPPVPPALSDEDLLRLFATAVGDAVYSDTIAGSAAIWMLYEDPSRNSVPTRSPAGWIQRYLLVYLYYSTTQNRATSWLSCNPSSTKKDDTDEPPRKGDKEDERNVDTTTTTTTIPTNAVDVDDTCKFTYPTEIPGGRIIYDLVPSYRWLSGTDECQWGGVACGKTVFIPALSSDQSSSSGIGIGDSVSSYLAVTSLVLADQNLVGSIMTELTQLPHLELLDLSHNNLQGTLDETFRSLRTVRLQYNALSGTIPSNFFGAESRMQELNVGANVMKGTIPKDIGFASHMEDLYLFDNQFTGTIPIFGNMPLRTFQGQANQFKGPLPFDLDYGGVWPETMRVWWAFDNKLTGSLPPTISFLANLEELRLSDNQLTGTIPESLFELSNLFRLEVDSNFFRGTIPEEISTLSELRTVKVQFNAFTGAIPISVCFLDSIEVLEADCLPPKEEEDDDDGSGGTSSVVATATSTSTSTSSTTQECYCCTTCCNDVTKECVTYEL